jgi:hypothetical protein
MGNVDIRIANSLNCSTIWRDDVLSYIAGYIVKKITVCIKCPECAIALVAVDNSQSALPDHCYSSNSQCKSPSLITFKSYGKLVTPSQSVVKVVTATDRKLRALFGDNWSSLNKRALSSLKSDVLQEVKATSFECLEQHSRESHVLDEQFREDHITIIINKIIDLYVKIFSHRFGKVYTDRVVREGKSSKRPKLTKLILFGND